MIFPVLYSKLFIWQILEVFIKSEPEENPNNGNDPQSRAFSFQSAGRTNSQDSSEKQVKLFCIFQNEIIV